MGTNSNAGPFGAALRRWWWVIVAATIVAGTIGYVVSSQARPTYQATAQLLVGPINADGDTQKTATALAATYTYYVTSQPVVDATSADLGAAIDDQYAWGQTLARSPKPRFLSITVKSDDPDLAARIANRIAANLMARVASQTSRPEAALTMVEPAQPPHAPVTPKPFRTALVSGLAAFLGVVAIAVLVETTGLIRTRRRGSADDELSKIASEPF